MKTTVGLTGFAIIGALLTIPFISFLLSYLIETGMKCIQEKKNSDTLHNKSHIFSVKQSFFVLFGIYLLGIIAILRANFNYIDDIGRVAEGYKLWGYFSRILSNLFSTFIHMDNYLTDVSPLPQIIAMAIMAAIGVILLVVLYERTQFAMIEIIALIPLCLNPYFLECISYKYDAPYMAMSVFGAIFPLLYRKRSAIAYITVSAIGTIIVCTTYQAASGIYPMLVILMMLRMWNNQEKSNGQIAQFCVRSVIGYGVGTLIFKIFIMQPAETYVSNSLPGIKSFIPNFVQNLGQYYSLVQSDFKWWWLTTAVLLMVAFVWKIARNSKHSQWKAIALSILAILCMGVLCFGLYPALTDPLYSPRAMYGFGIFLTFLMVAISEHRNDIKNNNIIIKTPAIILSLAFFVFAFTYGNALYSQKEYTEFRINQVIEDLNDLEVLNSEESVTVQITGSIGRSPVIDNMPQNYQILNRLVPNTFGDVENGWGQYRFYNYYKLKNVVSDSSIDLTTYDLPVIEDHMYHTIRGNGNYILIELK
jgi:hypothetical protein